MTLDGAGPSVLITGANRGLGLEFARQYGRGLACVRDLPGARCRAGPRRSRPPTGGAAQRARARRARSRPGQRPRRRAGRPAHRRALEQRCPLGAPRQTRRKTLVMLSSRLASIASNETGGRYMYRSARAGLNALVRSLAIDLAPRGVVCVALSPGWARTDLGGPDALLAAADSVAGMRAVIDGLDLAQTGRFLVYDGSALPW